MAATVLTECRELPVDTEYPDLYTALTSCGRQAIVR